MSTNPLPPPRFDFGPIRLKLKNGKTVIGRIYGREDGRYLQKYVTERIEGWAYWVRYKEEGEEVDVVVGESALSPVHSAME